MGLPVRVRDHIARWTREGVLVDPLGTSNVEMTIPDDSSWPGPGLLVVAAVLFGLWSLRAEHVVVAYPNDSGMHFQMSWFAHHVLASGFSPFDHWYPLLSLGSPFFVQYQSASAVVVGLLGFLWPVASVYAWSLYVLLALWPLCVYVTGRLFGWDRWVSSIAAAMAPLLFSVTGRGFGHQSYIWIGSGLWSQLVAMWTLPLAWALSWRWIARREYPVAATLVLSLTVALHFLTAYLAVLVVGAWLVIVPTAWRARLVRAAVLGLGVGLLTLSVTLPIVLHATWLAVNQFQVGTTINNSYGAPQVWSWLVHGDLFDWKRWPVLTVLVAGGLVVSGRRWRRDERVRALVAAFAVSLVLFCGRPTFSWLIDRLPGSQSLLLQRYLMGVQLAGLFLAALALVTLGRLFRHGATRWSAGMVAWLRTTFAGRWAPLGTGLLALVVVTALLPGYREITRYDTNSRNLINAQLVADAQGGRSVQALVAMAESRGGGRLYAGMPSNWGHHFYVGDVPVYIYLEQLGVDAVGFTLRTTGLMTDPECYFDQANLADYEIFGVRYLLLPASWRAPVAVAQRLATNGDYALWQIPARYPTGLFQVVDVLGRLAANNATLGPVTRDFLRSSAALRGQYPAIAFAGHPAAPATTGAGRPGTVAATAPRFDETALENAQRLSVSVTTTRRALVLFKATYDPGWHATVNGRAAPVVMVAPALMGVEVGPGTATVVFTYRGFAWYPETVLVAVVTLAALVWGTRRWRRQTRAPMAEVMAEATRRQASESA